MSVPVRAASPESAARPNEPEVAEMASLPVPPACVTDPPFPEVAVHDDDQGEPSAAGNRSENSDGSAADVVTGSATLSPETRPDVSTALTR